MVTPSTSSAITAAQNGAVHFTRVTSWPVPTSVAITSPQKRFPGDQPGGREHAGIFQAIRN